jgi:hypothetical protein
MMVKATNAIDSTASVKLLCIIAPVIDCVKNIPIETVGLYGLPGDEHNYATFVAVRRVRHFFDGGDVLDVDEKTARTPYWGTVREREGYNYSVAHGLLRMVFLALVAEILDGRKCEPKAVTALRARRVLKVSLSPRKTGICSGRLISLP